jgi:hypothetical protein
MQVCLRIRRQQSELIEKDTIAAEARLVAASAALKLALSTALRAK